MHFYPLKATISLTLSQLGPSHLSMVSIYDLLLFQDMRVQDVSAILDFMYNGEVNVKQVKIQKKKRR